MKTSHLTYEQRATLAQHPLAKKLLTIIAEKQTNLALAADVTSKQQLLTLAHQLGPELCVLKTHIDIVEDFDQDLVDQLVELAKRHQFLIFEDRKFADIGNTVKHQYQHGIYHIAAWADIINAHILPGPGIIAGLKQVGLAKQRGLLLLAQMSSADNFFTDHYTQASVALAKQHADFVIGFIAQQKLIDEPGFIHLTPGVQLQQNTDAIGQQYNTPESVITRNGSDVIIVGRAIYQADDPLAAAQQFRQAGWQAYVDRLA